MMPKKNNPKHTLIFRVVNVVFLVIVIYLSTGIFFDDDLDIAVRFDNFLFSISILLPIYLVVVLLNRLFGWYLEVKNKSTIRRNK